MTDTTTIKAFADRVLHEAVRRREATRKTWLEKSDAHGAAYAAKWCDEALTADFEHEAAQALATMVTNVSDVTWPRLIEALTERVTNQVSWIVVDAGPYQMREQVGLAKAWGRLLTAARAAGAA